MANPDAPTPAESPALTPVVEQLRRAISRLYRHRTLDATDPLVNIELEFIGVLDALESSRLASVSRRLAALEGEPWQPIETAPKDGTEILLAQIGSNGYQCIEHGSWEFIEVSDWDGLRVYGWCSDTGDIDEPTHWRPKLPLPPPPADALARLQQETL